MLFDEIETVLIADPSVSALVASNQIYLGGAIKAPSFPCVQLRSTGGAVDTVLDEEGESGLRNKIYQFDCYASLESSADNLAVACRQALAGTHASFSALGLSEPVLLYEEEHHAHRASFEMSFWFE